MSRGWNIFILSVPINNRLRKAALARLGSDSKESQSWATSVTILQLGSEIPSIHWKSELNLVHAEGSVQARLRVSSGFSELSSEPSQCEMAQYFFSPLVSHAHKVCLFIGMFFFCYQENLSTAVSHKNIKWQWKDKSKLFWFLWIFYKVDFLKRKFKMCSSDKFYFHMLIDLLRNWQRFKDGTYWVQVKSQSKNIYLRTLHIPDRA